MMTEVEIKKLPCPLSYAARERAPWPCLASGCPMWRWSEAAFSSKQTLSKSKPGGGNWSREGETDSWVRYGPDRRGYCGLAGAPQ